MTNDPSSPAAQHKLRPANISLKQLRGFAAVARAGSFTRAAEQLCLSQSALSALIRGIEAELGLRLLDRTTRRLELTEAGHELVPTVERLLADLDRAAHELREAAQARRGRVRLGATPLLAASMMPELLAGFGATHPGIVLSLMDAGTDQLLTALRQGELDLALATFDAVDPDLEALPLFSDPMVAVCAAGHALAARASLSWAELREQPLLLIKPGSGLRALVERVLAPLGGCPRPAQEVGQVTTALALAAAGLGVAVLPAYALRAGAQSGVVGLPLSQPQVLREVSLVRLRQRSLSPAGAAMVAYLQSHLQPPAAPALKRSRRRAAP